MSWIDHFLMIIGMVIHTIGVATKDYGMAAYGVGLCIFAYLPYPEAK